MSTPGSRSYPDSVRLAELAQKLREFKSDLSAIIERSDNSKVISRLIMASGLLEGAVEELSKSVSQQRD
jgi:hypothetical protein